jgi:hypothetical protein
MNLEYKTLLPAGFAASSKVWIYQASRLFSISEALKIEGFLEDFIKTWKSHGAPVKGFATLFFGRFIILMADETATTVGGCSTDSSVHVIKKIEQETGVAMFDRQTLAFVIKDKIETLPLNQVAYALENGFIKADTLYFNNTVLTKQELENNWLIPVKNSWLASRYNLQAV